MTTKRNASPSLRSIAMMGLLGALQGCATMTDPSFIAKARTVRTYAPLDVEAKSATQDRWVAARALVDLDGWRIVRSDALTGEIVAVHDSATSSELRDHVVIAVDARRTLVSLRTEVRDDAGGWTHSAMVCGGYSHSRERVMASLIEATAHQTSDGKSRGELFAQRSLR